MKIREAIMILSASLVVAAAAGCASMETKPVWFSSEPKTIDEQAVAKVLEGLITAYNGRNYDQLLAYYAPDAKIKSLAANAVVSREEHLAAVKMSKYLPKEEMGKIRITMAPPDQARAEAELSLLRTSWDPYEYPDVYPIVYNFIRRDGQWFVIEEKLPGILLFRLAKR